MATKQRWEVVGGGGEKGGIVVREAQELTSPQFPIRLQTGAVLEEKALVGQRLHYRKLTGEGPLEGWASLKLKDKVLVAPLAVPAGSSVVAAASVASFDAGAPAVPASCVLVSADEMPTPLKGTFSEARQFLEGQWAAQPAQEYQPKKLAATLAAKCDAAVSAWSSGDPMPAAYLIQLGELHFRGGAPIQAAAAFQTAAESAGTQGPVAEVALRLAHLGVAASAQCAEELKQEGGPSCVDGAARMASALALHRRSFASLEDTSVDGSRYLGDRNADAAIILLHGHGGNGLDLKSAGETLLAKMKHPCRLLLPKGLYPAPNLLGQHGCSWRDDRSDRCDPFRWDSVLRALAQLGAIFDFLEADGVPPERVIIGGFSQGSFFSILLAFTRVPRVGGILVLGGAVGGRVAAFVRTMTGGKVPPGIGSVPAFIGHGAADDKVPLTMGQMAVKELESLGVQQVKFTAYPGVGHSIPKEMLADAAVGVREWLSVGKDQRECASL